MISKGKKSCHSSDEVQLSYLLFKVKNLLEAAKQHFYAQGANSETVRQIEKTLVAIKSLPDQFDEN